MELSDATFSATAAFTGAARLALMSDMASRSGSSSPVSAASSSSVSPRFSSIDESVPDASDRETASVPEHRPLRDYLEIRTAAPANFSADGSKVLVQTNLPGTAQLYVLPSSGGELRQITDFDEPVGGAYL